MGALVMSSGGIFLTAGFARDVVDVGVFIWNECIKLITSLLSVSAFDFNEGSTWSLIEPVRPVFTGLGASLAVLFFIIGFCSESIEIKEEMRFETALRMLLRIGITEWLVVNTLDIIQNIFAVSGNLVNQISGTVNLTLSIPAELDTAIKDCNFFEGLLLCIVSFTIALVIAFAGFSLLYIIYSRMFKLLVMIPFAPVASAALAGNRTISQTCVSYFKSLAGLIFSAAVISLMLLVCSSVAGSGGLFSTSGFTSALAKAFVEMLMLCFTCLLTVGSVKGAESLMHKFFGL